MPRSWLYGAAAWLVLAACGNDLGDDVSASTGLPCDVQAILTDHCERCHGATLADGAPIHLRTHADLTATLGGRTVGQRCLDRMRSTMAQMPPPPAAPLAAAEISTFQAWIAAGAPSGDCTGGTGGIAAAPGPGIRAYPGPRVARAGHVHPSPGGSRDANRVRDRVQYLRPQRADGLRREGRGVRAP